MGIDWLLNTGLAFLVIFLFWALLKHLLGNIFLVFRGLRPLQRLEDLRLSQVSGGGVCGDPAANPGAR